jgi:hypothetical protein
MIEAGLTHNAFEPTHGVTPRTPNLFIYVHVGALRMGSQSTDARQRRR